jgi:predicted AlkP superfamily pyrophosphatase or phosphodiesterase
MVLPADLRCILPDYAGGSLLNLMQSLQSLLHAEAAVEEYLPLHGEFGLEAACSTRVRHIMLVVIDGLGCRQLAVHSPTGWFSVHQGGTLTSVFPSTTASAIPTFLSGLSPRCHGLLGWQIRDEQTLQIVNTFPLTPRTAEGEPSKQGELADRLLDYRPLADRLSGSRCWIAPADIAGSAFNRAHSGGGPMIGYRDLGEFAQALETACDYHRVAGRDVGHAPGYTYAYCPYPDTLMHRRGTAAPEVGEAIRAIEATIASFRSRQGPDLLLLVTADHGFIDAPPERLVEIEPGGTHAEWLNYLDSPLWGERRTAFASVPCERRDRFRTFVATRHGEAFDLLTAEEFLAGPWLGDGRTHPSLRARLGDFVLLAKDDWTIKDWLPGERRYSHLGVHSGRAADEMRVPLILAP